MSTYHPIGQVTHLDSKKPVTNSSPSAEFTNAVDALVAKGVKRDDAFQRIQRERPDLLRKMHRPPLLSYQHSALSRKLRSEFANAGDALGSTLTAGKFPVQLAAALNIQSTDAPQTVKQKVIQGAAGLDSDMLAVLWQTIIDCIKTNVGSILAAQSKAQSLLPSLLSLCGSAS